MPEVSQRELIAAATVEVATALADPGYHLIVDPSPVRILPDAEVMNLVRRLIRTGQFTPIFGPDGKIIGNVGEGGHPGAAKPGGTPATAGHVTPEHQAAMLKTYRDARAAGKGHNSAVKIVSDTHGVAKEHVSGHLNEARAAEKAGKGVKPAGAGHTVPAPKPDLSHHPDYQRALSYGMTPHIARDYTAVRVARASTPADAHAVTGVDINQLSSQAVLDHTYASVALEALDAGQNPYNAVADQFAVGKTQVDAAMNGLGIQQQFNAKAAAVLKPDITGKYGYKQLAAMGANDDQIRQILAGNASYLNEETLQKTYGVSKAEAQAHATNAAVVMKAKESIVNGKNPYLAVAGGKGITKVDQQAIYKQYGVHNAIEEHVQSLKGTAKTGTVAGAKPPTSGPPASVGATKITNANSAYAMATAVGMPASKAPLFGALTEAKMAGSTADYAAIASKWGVSASDLKNASSTGYGAVTKAAVEGLKQGKTQSQLLTHVQANTSYPVSANTLKEAFTTWGLDTSKLPGAVKAAAPAAKSASKATGHAASHMGGDLTMKGVGLAHAGYKEGHTAATTGSQKVWSGKGSPVFSANQSEALHAYSGSAYVTINNTLRGMNGSGATIPAQVHALDGAFKVADSGPVATTVTRGVGAGKCGQAMKNMKPGQSFVDPGFVSTSHGGNNFGGTVMRITVPPHSRTIKFGASAGQHSHEKETLVDRHSAFRLDSISPDGTMNFTLIQTPLTQKPAPSASGV